MMKSVTHSRGIVVLSTILLTVLSLAQPAFSDVGILGDWVTGLTHAKEAGSNRVLILIAQAEYSSS
ncbi:MAG: hypothetical protein PHQ35_03885, partial [Phycisphaerae bacterium]|nr:hypothetical protein [Phycisphaerae bacterium]MDD5380342.1 hypothetical protein [Phycisphaerae bacterium]